MKVPISERTVVPGLCLALALAAFVVYAPTLKNGFVNFDDPVYVTRNAHVLQGPTLQSLRWALTATESGNWHPLTWLSHMLDVALFGPRPGAHHLVSLLLHVAASILLFLILCRITSAHGRSFMVAALFALHPLHVESVAWISERKDVLSAALCMTTLWVWCLYVERRGLVRYLAALGLFAVGLAAKPMLVSLPMVLLLLDVWPLRRLAVTEEVGRRAPPDRPGRSSRGEGGARLGSARTESVRRLLLEKLPFVALSIVSCALTLIAQRRGGAVRSLEEYPLGLRIENALVSYARYLGKTLWPADLAVLYPHPHVWGIPFVLGAAGLIAVVTLLVLGAARRLPYLAVGWLWFLGTLVPVIGLVQVGNQAIADRYMYLPSIGLFAAAVWGLSDLAAARRFPARTLLASGGAVLALCAVASFLQTRHWRDSVALFERAIAVTNDNPAGHYNLALALAETGRTDDAIAHLEEALRLAPHNAEARLSLGALFARKGRGAEAIAAYEEALRADPGSARAHLDLGLALAAAGRPETAAGEFAEAARLDPSSAEARYNLGVALAARGRLDEARTEYLAAIRIDPGHVSAHNNLGNLLARRGDLDGAIAEYESALRLAPASADTHVNLGAALAGRGRFDEAFAEYDRALLLDPANVDAHLDYAADLAARGRIEDAVSHLRRAVALRPGSPQVRYQLGRLLLRLGRRDEAAVELREALRLKPDWPEARQALEEAGAGAAGAGAAGAGAGGARRTPEPAGGGPAAGLGAPAPAAPSRRSTEGSGAT